MVRGHTFRTPITAGDLKVCISFDHVMRISSAIFYGDYDAEMARISILYTNGSEDEYETTSAEQDELMKRWAWFQERARF